MPSPTSDHTRLSRGYSIAVASAVFLSTTAIFIRFLTVNFAIPPLVLAFWRDIFVALTLLPILGIFYPHLLRVNRRHLVYLLLYGLVLAVFNSIWTISVAINGAAVSTVLVYCSAAFTALLGWWLLKESFSWGKLCAIVLCLGGCVLVSGVLTSSSQTLYLAGILTGVLSGLCYAAYSMLGRSASQRGLNPWTTLFYTFSFAAIFLLVVNLTLGRFLPEAAKAPGELFWLGDSFIGWGVLFLLAAGPTVAGFGLYNTSLHYLPASVANLIVTLEPAFTTITAYLFLGERLTGLQAGGSLLILAGVVSLRVYEGWIANKGKPLPAVKSARPV